MISPEVSNYVNFGYFLAIFLLSLSVFLQTRKLRLYSTYNRGIRYFNDTFLYFALTYLFRFITLNIQLSGNLINGDLKVAFQSISQFLVIYFSFLAIFSLIASFSWKTFPQISANKLNLTSLFLACITFFIKTPEILFIVSIFAVVSFCLLKVYNNSKQKIPITQLFIVYTLLLVFMLFDLVPFIQSQLPVEFRFVSYVGIVCIFLFINLKVNKVLGNGKNET